jgi:hypothetical protein
LRQLVKRAEAAHENGVGLERRDVAIDLLLVGLSDARRRHAHESAVPPQSAERIARSRQLEKIEVDASRAALDGRLRLRERATENEETRRRRRPIGRSRRMKEIGERSGGGGMRRDRAFRKRGNERAARAVQRRKRNDRTRRPRDLERPQLERRLPEAPELVAQRRLVQRGRPGYVEARVAGHTRYQARRRSPFELEGLTDRSGEPQVERHPPIGLREHLVNALVPLRIARLEDAARGRKIGQAHIRTEPDARGLAGTSARHVFPADLDAPHAAAELAVAREAALHEDPVSARQVGADLEYEHRLSFAVFRAAQPPDFEPAMIASATFHEALVIDTAKKPGSRAACERLERHASILLVRS